MTLAYSIDAWQAAPEQLAGMLANVNRIEARKQIDKRDFEGLDHDGIYALYLTAFEDERIAQEAQTAWLTTYVKNSCNAAGR